MLKLLALVLYLTGRWRSGETHPSFLSLCATEQLLTCNLGMVELVRLAAHLVGLCVRFTVWELRGYFIFAV